LRQVLPLLPLGLLLIPALAHSGQVFPLNGPHWSLSFELIANALHALVLARLRSIVLIGLAAASGIWLGWAIASYGSNEFGMDNVNWVDGIPRVIFSYTMGVLFARGYRRGWPTRLRWNWAMAVAVPLTAIMILPQWQVPKAPGDILFTLFLLPLFFALTIGSRLPEHLVPMFSGLGLLSYPLYAVHLPIVALAAMLPPVFLRGLAGPVAALLLAAFLAKRMEAASPRTSLADKTPQTEIASAQRA
jgi:peptidoglycan/LPS O-acetylase OafA/YrhL